MQAKIISIINQKGGCGKTVSTYNIAACLVDKGYKVLMIDNDQQASLTMYAGFLPGDFTSHLDQVYLGMQQAKGVIYNTKFEGLFLIPASIKLASVENLLIRQGRIGRETLAEALNAVRDEFDYILIDCPPALSMLTTNALFASDYAIAPCQTSPLCTPALVDLMETVSNVSNLMAGKFTFLGVLATLHRKSVKVNRAELEKLEENYNVLGVIKESADVQNSILEGIPVIQYKRRAEVSAQYIDATDRILEEIEKCR